MAASQKVPLPALWTALVLRVESRCQPGTMLNNGRNATRLEHRCIVFTNGTVLKEFNELFEVSPFLTALSRCLKPLLLIIAKR